MVAVAPGCDREASGGEDRPWQMVYSQPVSVQSSVQWSVHSALSLPLHTCESAVGDPQLPGHSGRLSTAGLQQR